MVGIHCNNRIITLEYKEKDKTIKKMFEFLTFLDPSYDKEVITKNIDEIKNIISDKSNIIVWDKETVENIKSLLDKNYSIIDNKNIIILLDKILSKMYIKSDYLYVYSLNNANDIIDIYDKLTLNELVSTSKIIKLNIIDSNTKDIIYTCIINSLAAGKSVIDGLLLYYGITKIYNNINDVNFDVEKKLIAVIEYVDNY